MENQWQKDTEKQGVRSCGRLGDPEGGGSNRCGKKEISLWYILEGEISVITEVRKGKNQSNWRDGRLEDER